MRVKIAMGCFLAMAVAFGQPLAGVFDGSSYVTFTPNQPEATQLGSYRIEFRVSGFGVRSQMQGIIGNNDGDTQCVIMPEAWNIRCRNWRGGDAVLALSLAGRTDVRVRYQRNNESKLESLEVWNADGSAYMVTSTQLTPVVFNASTRNFIGSVWGPGSQFAGQIDFVRWYSSALPLKSRIPQDSVVAVGNILNVELNGSVQDLSPGNLVMGIVGGIQYVKTQLFPPAARAVGATVRTGASAVLDGSLSSSLSDDLPLRAEWACTYGGVSCAVNAPNSLVASFVPPQAGSYVMKLTVTDSAGLSASTSMEIGAVTTDSQGRISLPSPELEMSIGPLLRSGSSPWSWFDKTEIDAADAIIAAIPAAPGDVPDTGSVSVTQGSNVVIGSGTAFRRTFACDGSDNIMLHYPVPGEPNGRRVYSVTGCVSDTQLVISPAYDASANASGVPYAGVPNWANAQWVNGSNNWNYYDTVVALYRVYYRTGFERFRTAARSLADKWYQYPFDRGRAWTTNAGYHMLAPRLISLTGLMLRANDGKPEYWPAITYVGEWQHRWLTGWYPWNKQEEVGDLREQGYASLYTVEIAILHPDSAVRNRFRDYAITAFTTWWRPTQRSNGGWYFNLGANQNYYGLGTLPWQGSFTATYLVALHRLTGRQEILVTLRKFADFMEKYGIDPRNDGGYYDAYYQFCPDWSASSDGSVAVTSGSAVVTGQWTNFRSRYRCNGSDAIAIQDRDGYRRFYTVASCQSDTSLTLAQNYAGGSDAGLRHLRYESSAAVSGCGICPWGTCGTYGEGAKADARSLLNGSHSYFGYLYSAGQGTKYRDIGDRLFAKNLGPGGPGGDAEHGHYDDALKGVQTYLAKSFAFVGGASGAQPYLAWRLGPQSTPVSKARVNIPVTMSDGRNGDHARLRLYDPDGTVTESECAPEACIAEIDEYANGYTYEIVTTNARGDTRTSTNRQTLQPATQAIVIRPFSQ